MVAKNSLFNVLYYFQWTKLIDDTILQNNSWWFLTNDLNHLEKNFKRVLTLRSGIVLNFTTFPSILEI